jgi:hypothetical protein
MQHNGWLNARFLDELIDVLIAHLDFYSLQRFVLRIRLLFILLMVIGLA